MKKKKQKKVIYKKTKNYSKSFREKAEMDYLQEQENVTIYNCKCLDWLKKDDKTKIHLTFLDPPFNQGKEYKYFDDSLPDTEYWDFMGKVLSNVYAKTVDGGAVYFMQREKKAEFVLHCLRKTGWTLHNLIVWKKKTSAVPCSNKFGKQYQIIAFATKGKKPRVFNRLRISPPLPAGYKYERENGLYVTDVWDDIRELTAGYFAGDEAIKKSDGTRFHKQQSPMALLLRIILSSTNADDVVLDPFAGTGTTLVVASQLNRKAIGIEVDPENVKCIEDRLKTIKKSDDIEKYYKDYKCTENLNKIWGTESETEQEEQERGLLNDKFQQATLFN
ncbi:MAG: site-specific DNA-methyltransferase [Elusimicrobiota bacterium]|nr:site-specific DNA-methyltransferase [Elusimicrobiota bacterium]